jgi:tetratricopeptide (TPR) repeat protein
MVAQRRSNASAATGKSCVAAGERDLPKSKEIRMTPVSKVWRGAALIAVLALATVALAQNADFERAQRLFEQQKYVAAQELLLQVDPGALSDSEARRYDELLRSLPDAIKGQERAAVDIADADQAYAAGDWDRAESLYRQVASNPHALSGVRSRAESQIARIAEKRNLAEAAAPEGTVEGSVVTEVETVQVTVDGDVPPPTGAPVIRTDTRRLTPTDELRLRDALLWQRAVAKANKFSAEARAAMAAGDYQTARQSVVAALQTIEAAAHYAEPVAKYTSAKTAVQQLQTEIEQAQIEADAREAQSERDVIAERVRMRRELIERQRAEKVAQLFNTADQLKRERRFAEAAEVYREILRIDPDNTLARERLGWAEDFESYAKQAQWQHDVNTQTREALIDAERALIPWAVDMMYPKNWLELSEARRDYNVGTGSAVEDVELQRELQETIPTTRFEETSLEIVMNWLSDITKVNMSVDWTDLESYAINRDRPVTMQLNGVPFRTVLEEILEQVGGDTELAYAVGDGLLRIATKEKLDRDKFLLDLRRSRPAGQYPECPSPGLPTE